MINFKIFFENSFKSCLDEIKKIIFRSTTKISQAIHDALPNGISLQNDQIFLHQLEFTVTLIEDQFPHKIQIYLVVLSGSQCSLLGCEQLIQDLRGHCVLVLLPLKAAKYALACSSQLLFHEVLSIDSLPVQEIDGKYFILLNVLQCKYN
jgi:hypothetical protein